MELGEEDKCVVEDEGDNDKDVESNGEDDDC
jgi:hypothetical protein